MNQQQIAILLGIIVVILLIAMIGFTVARKRRSRLLRARFGPEYDRVLEKEGELRRAEGVLEIRAKRRDAFVLRPLSEDAQSDFAERWRIVQAQFVDDPQGSVSGADELVDELMAARGYPIADFNQRAADISVDHPVVVENYRAAHDIALRHHRGEANTEDLRKAMVHYRSLFDELLHDSQTSSTTLDSLPRRKEA